MESFVKGKAYFILMYLVFILKKEIKQSKILY